MTDDTSELAFFTHDEPGPRFTRADLVRAIKETGVPESTALARVNNFVKKRQISLRDAPGTHRRFAAADLAAALVLSAITDAGVGDQEVLQRASIALYYSRYGAEARKAEIASFSPHPAGWALAGVYRNESWVCTVNIWRDRKTQTRIVDADLTRDAMPHVWPDYPATALPIAAITVVLDAQLQPAIRLMSPFSSSAQ